MVTPDLLATAAQQLKHHTSQQHEALERIVLPQLQALQAPADYMHFLKQFYGYFKPVEQLIEQQLDEQLLPDIQERRKADSILQDLTFSKAHIQDLPLATTLPEVKNKYQAFGAMYVLEGSTLGGRAITKMLLKNTSLNLQPSQVHFFNGYGSQTCSRWTAFLEILNAVSQTASAQQQMIAAANETFLFFKTWLLKNDA